MKLNYPLMGNFYKKRTRDCKMYRILEKHIYTFILLKKKESVKNWYDKMVLSSKNYTSCSNSKINSFHKIYSCCSCLVCNIL